MSPEISDLVLDARLEHLEGEPEAGRRVSQNREVIGGCKAMGGAAAMVVAREDIRAPTQWRIEEDRHSLIIHLGGTMRRLETRINGAPPSHHVPAAGDLWLIPGGRRYTGLALGGSITYLELQLTPEWLADAFEVRNDRARDLLPQLKQRDSTLHALAIATARLCGQTDDLAGLGQETYAHAMCLHLLRTYSRRRTSFDGQQVANAFRSAKVRARLEQHVREHLADHLTLAGLAAVTGMGTHRMLRDFRVAYGMTPIQYVIAERLRHACELLRTSNQGITEVAISCGFASHSHLSAMFRARLGVSPSQFRRDYRVV